MFLLLKSSTLALAAVRSKAVILLLLIRCWLLLPLSDSLIIMCFVGCYVVSMQLSRWGRESWLLCFACLPGVFVIVVWLFGFVCSL